MTKNMHKALIIVSLAILNICLTGCPNPQKVFENQNKLDSLINGSLDYGDIRINEAMIRKLNYQKVYNTGNKGGVVIPKEMLSVAVNGFTANQANPPADSSNYDRWDFLIAYPGLTIDSQGNTKEEPAIFFYKGQDVNSTFSPIGKPVIDLSFPGGGGGPGMGAFSTPPPN